MTLFDHHSQRELDRKAPLAARMRPRTFDEFVGQDHIVGPSTVLRRSIEAPFYPALAAPAVLIGGQIAPHVSARFSETALKRALIFMFILTGLIMFVRGVV